MANKTQSYQELKQELDTVMAKLRHEDTDVDAAVELHKQGTELISKLEKYLHDVAKSVNIEK